MHVRAHVDPCYLIAIYFSDSSLKFSISARHSEWYFVYTSIGLDVENVIIPVFKSVEKEMLYFSVSTIFFSCDI